MGQGLGGSPGLPSAPLRQRARVHEAGKLVGGQNRKIASETGAIHSKDFGSNTSVSLKSTTNQRQYLWEPQCTRHLVISPADAPHH